MEGRKWRLPSHMDSKIIWDLSWNLMLLLIWTLPIRRRASEGKKKWYFPTCERVLARTTLYLVPKKLKSSKCYSMKYWLVPHTWLAYYNYNKSYHELFPNLLRINLVILVKWGKIPKKWCRHSFRILNHNHMLPRILLIMVIEIFYSPLHLW